MAIKTKKQLASEIRAAKRETHKLRVRMNKAQAALGDAGIVFSTLEGGVRAAVHRIDGMKQGMETLRVDRDKEAALREQNYKMATEYERRAERAEKTADILLRLSDALVGKTQR